MSKIIAPSEGIILLEPIKLESIGGGIMEVASVGSDKDKQQVGKVLAIGRVTKKKPLPVDELKEGSIVAYRRYGDTRFLIKGAEYVFVQFEDILGVINK